MAIVVESYNSSSATDTDSVVVTKPSGVATGDLLIIIAGNDCPNSTIQWDNSTYKPTGFTFIQEAGNGTSDSHVAAFWRVVDGTEGASFTVPAQGVYDFWTFVLHITGADTSSPIDVIGSTTTSSSLPITTPSADTTEDACIGLAIMAGDGGDLIPYTWSTNSWIKGADKQAGTGASNGSGSWAYKTIASAGAMGTATVDSALTDGAVTYMFAISPAAGTTTTTTTAASEPLGGRIKYWNGSIWLSRPLKYWTGSVWEEGNLKHWNGSAWVPATNS